MRDEQRQQAEDLIEIIKWEDLPEPEEFYTLLIRRFRNPLLAKCLVEVVWAYLEDILDIYRRDDPE